MKKILCYGDSNTWGCSPRDGFRYDEKTRWPMVAGSILGENFTIIEEGLNGRTVLNLSPVEKKANGIEYAASLMTSCVPVDIAVICLGTNDVFIYDESTPASITAGAEEIIDIIRNSHAAAGFKPPAIVIMSPPGFNTGIEGIAFFELQVNKLKCLPDSYRELSLQKKCFFFDASAYVTGSEIDGSHLEPEGHILLGRKIAEFIMEQVLNEN